MQPQDLYASPCSSPSTVTVGTTSPVVPTPVHSNTTNASSTPRAVLSTVHADDCFEGCEKRLLLTFVGEGDLRTLATSEWSRVLEHGRCAILNTIRNAHCIAHLLSESSLFVFHRKVMIKTCGATTLLLILPPLLKLCSSLQLSVQKVLYSRSDFMFPSQQPDMHQSFDKEVTYLDRFFEGRGVVLGSNQALWHCYHGQTLEHSKLVIAGKKKKKKKNVTLEVVMFDLDPARMRRYFADAKMTLGQLDGLVRKGCCIPERAQSCQLDSYQFKPCGYSLNAICADKYWSVHVTPEPHASYVSFESNYDYGDSHHEVVRSVVTYFAPKRFSFAMNGARVCNVSVGFDGFFEMDRSSYTFEKGHEIAWQSWSIKDVHVEDERAGVQEEKKVEREMNASDGSLWSYIQHNLVRCSISKPISMLFSFAPSYK